MAETKRTLAKAATRQRVVEAARLLFEAGGYEAATIRTIASVAGMSTGAVFASFTGKEALYAEIYGFPPVTPEAGLALAKALKDLTFAARTSGGTPGPDAGLMSACDAAETALARVALAKAA